MQGRSGSAAHNSLAMAPSSPRSSTLWATCSSTSRVQAVPPREAVGVAATVLEPYVAHEPFADFSDILTVGELAAGCGRMPPQHRGKIDAARGRASMDPARPLDLDPGPRALSGAIAAVEPLGHDSFEVSLFVTVRRTPGRAVAAVLT